MTHATRSARLGVEALETREVPATMLAINQAGRLLTFDSNNPSVLIRGVNITGLANPGERITDIDVRPGNGVLYGRSTSNFLYNINPFTGFASRLPGSVNVASTRIGLDFDPTVDRLRLVGNVGENIGLDPNTGAPVVVGNTLSYSSADVYQGQSPRVVGLAFTNSLPFALTTTGYGIDHVRDTLVKFNGPIDRGQVSTVGALGFDTKALVGLDIGAGSTFAFAALRAPGASNSLFARVSLTTGVASVLGRIGNSQLVSDIAILSGGSFPGAGSFLAPTTTTGNNSSPFTVFIQAAGSGTFAFTTTSAGSSSFRVGG